MFKKAMLVFLIAVIAGCAVSPKQHPEKLPAYRFAHDLFDEGPYGRNAIVCVPTTVAGHLVGVGAAVAALGLYSVGWPVDYFISHGFQPEQSRPVATMLSNLSWLLGDIGGLAVGTPFLPIAYLAKQSQCSQVLLF